MFKLIKGILLLLGLFVATKFGLNHFGYELNEDYFKERTDACHKELSKCQQNLTQEGFNEAQCDFKCIDTKLIVKKK